MDAIGKWVAIGQTFRAVFQCPVLAAPYVDLVAYKYAVNIWGGPRHLGLLVTVHSVAAKAAITRLVWARVVRFVPRCKHLCIVRSKFIVLHDLGVAVVKVAVPPFAVVIGTRGWGTRDQIFSVVLLKGRCTHLWRHIWLS